MPLVQKEIVKIEVSIEGLKELEEALKELPKATGKNVLRRAMTNAANPIAEAARGMAPVKTGKLKESIAVSRVRFSSGSAGKRAFAEAMARGASRSEAAGAAKAANVGADSDVTTSAVVVVGPGRHPQAIFQEFGTVHNSPRAFMRPAWDTNKMNALETIKVELANEIEKARARLAKKALRAVTT